MSRGKFMEKIFLRLLNCWPFLSIDIFLFECEHKIQARDVINNPLIVVFFHSTTMSTGEKYRTTNAPINLTWTTQFFNYNFSPRAHITWLNICAIINFDSAPYVSDSHAHDLFRVHFNLFFTVSFYFQNHLIIISPPPTFRTAPCYVFKLDWLQIEEKVFCFPIVFFSCLVGKLSQI